MKLDWLHLAESLPRSFYDIESPLLAKRLLNKVLVVRGVSGRIVETEAYAGAADAASHAYNGETPRNSVMFGQPGVLYVYFTYGMHFCCNVVAREEGVASAVLLRALIPIDGIDLIRKRRGNVKEKNLTDGPAKLCQALAVDRSDNGADIVTGDRGIEIFDDGVKPPRKPLQGPRVGIKRAVDLPWRFRVEH